MFRRAGRPTCSRHKEAAKEEGDRSRPARPCITATGILSVRVLSKRVRGGFDRVEETGGRRALSELMQPLAMATIQTKPQLRLDLGDARYYCIRTRCRNRQQTEPNRMSVELSRNIPE
jgi:hypothetical protein